MEYKDYVNIKRRMTKFGDHGDDCSIDCTVCPLYRRNNGLDVSCDVFETRYPEKAEEIVMNWSKEHPVETRLDKLLEMFPEAERHDYTAFICPKHVNTKYTCHGVSCAFCKKSYWLSEYEESKET